MGLPQDPVGGLQEIRGQVEARQAEHGAEVHPAAAAIVRGEDRRRDVELPLGGGLDGGEAGGVGGDAPPGEDPRHPLPVRVHEDAAGVEEEGREGGRALHRRALPTSRTFATAATRSRGR